MVVKELQGLKPTARSVGVRGIQAGLVMGVCAHSMVVLADPDLWLPSRYQRAMPQLEKAVDTVAQSEHCQKVIKGELLESKSQPGKPVFRVICRNESLKTYATIIDGVSFKELHASGETRLEQKQRHLPHYSRVCLNKLKEKAQRMHQPRFPEGSSLEPSLITGERIEFEVDFSAESLNGVELKYRGYCQFESMRDYTMIIKPRPRAK